MNEERIARALAAAEQLSNALWEAIHDELDHGRTGDAAALTENLSEVSRAVAVLAVAGRGGGTARPGVGRPRADHAGAPGPAVAAERRSAATHEGRHLDASARLGSAGVESRPAALVDEHDGVVRPIALHDARAAEPGSWIAAVQRKLDRYMEEKEPFALLLLEASDTSELRLASEAADGWEMRELEGAIVEQLRPADALIRERDGRYWLIAPQTDAVSARGLAERLSAACRRTRGRRGPLPDLAVGIAACPDHGLDAAVLTAHADIDLYAAQAAARNRGGRDDRPVA